MDLWGQCLTGKALEMWTMVKEMRKKTYDCTPGFYDHPDRAIRHWLRRMTSKQQILAFQHFLANISRPEEMTMRNFMRRFNRLWDYHMALPNIRENWPKGLTDDAIIWINMSDEALNLYFNGQAQPQSTLEQIWEWITHPSNDHDTEGPLELRQALWTLLGE